MSEIDELFDLRNHFYLGNYQSAVNEANKLKLNGETATERDVFLFRSLLAQKQYSMVNSEINSSAGTQLQAIKIYSTYLQNNNVDAANKQLESQLNSLSPENWISPIISASIMLHENRPEDALRALQLTDHIEGLAMQVQIYVHMERPDLSKKTLKIIMDKDEDATVSQLANAWTNLALGGDKLQESYYIYQELMDKHSSSPILLNGAAAAHIAQGKWEEAEGVVREAADKDPNYADTLINQIVTCTQSGRDDVARRTLNQLRSSCQDHPFVKDLAGKEADMDRLILQYMPA